MKKQLVILLIFLQRSVCFAQSDQNVTASYSFNKGEAINEVNGKKAKAEGVLFVDDRFGNSRSACYFHGSPGSYLNLGTGPELKTPKGSISVWVNIDIAMKAGLGYQFNPIVLVKNSESDDFYEAYTISYDFKVKKIVAASSLSGALQVALNASDTLVLNKWHHLVLTFDDDYLCLYINGELEAKIAKNFRTKYLMSDSVMVGNSANKKNARYLCGAVDDLVFYNEVINEKEVKRLYLSPDPNRYRVYFQWFYKTLAFTLLVVFLVWFFLNRYKRSHALQQEKNNLNVRLNELETKAIRSQMNPHFIFNSLNTLQRFMWEEDITKANDYLIKFSKLLRKLLESSANDTISLMEEIDILSTYIEIEKLRFDNTFEFKISNEIPNPEKVHIPLMLVQPFVENAIWHGLLAKQGHRLLTIHFSPINERSLLCRVEDNGVGRQNSLKRHDPFKKKSMALDFTKQRLEMFEKATGIACYFEVKDLMTADGIGCGTRVEIIIPIL